MPTLPCDVCAAPLGILTDARFGLAPAGMLCPTCSHAALGALHALERILR